MSKGSVADGRDEIVALATALEDGTSIEPSCEAGEAWGES